MYKRFGKRLIDIVLSTIAIVFLLFPMLIIAIIIKKDSPGPVLFKQRRIGIYKKEFTILKFRSMPTSVPKDVPTHQFNEKNKLTKWQQFMRKTSLDELPQLFNILLNHMSIVGPRPALWNQYDLIQERDRYGANDIKPGLTGWAQVNGRDELEISEKAKLDGIYATTLNQGKFKGFAMDIKCFFKTVISVLKSEGVVEGCTEKTVNTQTESEILDK